MVPELGLVQLLANQQEAPSCYSPRPSNCLLLSQKLLIRILFVLFLCSASCVCSSHSARGSTVWHGSHPIQSHLCLLEMASPATESHAQWYVPNKSLSRRRRLAKDMLAIRFSLEKEMARSRECFYSETEEYVSILNMFFICIIYFIFF